jgi:membrane fusion protein, peptide pheromone/bacteriocin exporter
MISEITELKETTLFWMPDIRQTGFIIYWLIILLFISGFISLFLLHIDLSVKATGVIQRLNEQKGIKPATSVFMGECYVPAENIGLIQKGQQVNLQIDQFDYRYFGLVTGSIYSIDDDYILIEKNPAFRVKCLIKNKTLKLSNGFKCELKNGMRFHARIITCKRSLWQLLFGRVDELSDPSRLAIQKNL